MKCTFVMKDNKVLVLDIKTSWPEFKKGIEKGDKTRFLFYNDNSGSDVIINLNNVLYIIEERGGE